LAAKPIRDPIGPQTKEHVCDFNADERDAYRHYGNADTHWVIQESSSRT
jgi:hypothetical protein